MKYKDKTLPVREVTVFNTQLVGHDTVTFNMVYNVDGGDTQTHTRQPIAINLCTMRQMCIQFHKVLDELEDELLRSRKMMKGNR